MAAAKKTRKELLKEPDEFITLSSRVLGFIATYKKTIGYACFGALLAAALFSGYIGYSGWRESAAAAMSVMLWDVSSRRRRAWRMRQRWR